MHKEQIEKFKDQFIEHRLTPQRRLVLEILMDNKDHHLSAEEVYRLSREKGEDIGIATVYRTLDLLEEMGLIHKLNFGDGRSRYELEHSPLEHQHHHLLCLNCQEIIEVEEDLLQRLEETIEKKHGFKIVDHRVQFFGYCQRCRET